MNPEETVVLDAMLAAIIEQQSVTAELRDEVRRLRQSIDKAVERMTREVARK